MPVITIPKGFHTHNNLVAVPRRAYEEFLMWQKKTKSAKTFKPTATEKKTLARARKDFTKGNYITLAELRHELDIDR